MSGSGNESDYDYEDEEGLFEDDLPEGWTEEGSRDFCTSFGEETGSVIKFNQTMIATNNVTVSSVNFGPALIIKVETGILHHFSSNVSGKDIKIYLNQEFTDTSAANSNNWIRISCMDESKIEEIEIELKNGLMTITVPQ